jgi:hypothetical protein
MRPFVPGFDFILDAAGNVRESFNTGRAEQQRVRGGMRSEIVTRPQTTKEKLNPITEDEAKQIMKKMRLYVQDRFNDGKPISTKSEAKSLLARHIPSFATGESFIEFIDELADDDTVIPEWARNYLDSFLLSIDAQPESVKFNFHMKKAPPSAQWEGAVSIRPGLSDFFRNPATGRMTPQRKRQPLIVFEYKEQTSLTQWQILLNDKERARQSLFNVGSVIVDAIASNRVRERGFPERVLKDFDALKIVENRFFGIENTLLEIASTHPYAPLLAAGDIAKEIDITFSTISDVEPEIKVDPQTNLQKLSWKKVTPKLGFLDDRDKEASFISQTLHNEWLQLVSDPSTTVADCLAFISKIKVVPAQKVNRDNKLRKYKRRIDDIENDSLNIMSGLVALHESNHMLHNMQATLDAMELAQSTRLKIIDEMVDNLRKNGIDITEKVIQDVENSVDVSDIYERVFVERAIQLAEQDPELAKRRLLHSDLFSDRALQPRISVDPKSRDPQNPSSYFGWREVDAVAEACKQMLTKFTSWDSVDESSLSNNKKIAKSAIRKFLTQPTYDGEEQIFIGDDLARILNEIDRFHGGAIAKAFSSDGIRFNPGDELNLGMIAHLINPSSLEEDGARRNIFSGLKLRQLSALLEEFGFPDFSLIDNSGRIQRVQGLNIDESRKLSAALLNIKKIAGSIPRNANGNVPSDLSVTATTSIRLSPGIRLPQPFSGMTKKEFLELPEDEFLEKYRTLMDETVMAFESNVPSDLYGTFIESGLTQMHWWDRLTKPEIDEMMAIMRRIGTPNLKEDRSGTGYATYMGTFTMPSYPGFASPPQFSEFFAELAIANTYGIPLSQIQVIDNDSGNKQAITRALSQNEINVIMKFLRWMYPNQILSEKLNSVQITEEELDVVT